MPLVKRRGTDDMPTAVATPSSMLKRREHPAEPASFPTSERRSRRPSFSRYEEPSPTRPSKPRYEEEPSPVRPTKARYDEPSPTRPSKTRYEELPPQISTRPSKTRYDEQAVLPTRNRYDESEAAPLRRRYEEPVIEISTRAPRYEEEPATIVSTRPSEVGISKLGSSAATFQGTQPSPRKETAPAPQPHSQAEQYWAARAVHAEAVLSAKLEHQADLKRTAQADELRMSREVRIIRAEAVDRQTKLERIVIALSSVVLLMTAVMGYLLLPQAPKQELRAWLHLPHHLTVPILSPFASTVEQEGGILTGRVLMACIPFVCILAYFGGKMAWTTYLDAQNANGSSRVREHRSAKGSHSRKGYDMQSEVSVQSRTTRASQSDVSVRDPRTARASQMRKGYDSTPPSDVSVRERRTAGASQIRDEYDSESLSDESMPPRRATNRVRKQR